MDRRQSRIEAIRRHLHGESVTSICSALGKSRRWFYYWIRRYSPTDGVWSEDRSRAPLHQRRKLPQSVERLVCEVRTRLLGRKYSQRGAVADLALAASHTLHDFPRVGDTSPTVHVFDGYDVIEATKVDTGFLGHSYVFESGSVLADVFELFKGTNPNKRLHLVPMIVEGKSYWSFQK